MMLLPFIILLLSDKITPQKTIDIDLLFLTEKCVEANNFQLEPNKNVQNILEQNEIMNEIRSNDVQTKTKSLLEELNELAAYNKITINYKFIDYKESEKLYKILLELGDETYRGVNTSIKKAKYSAAELALQSTNYDKPPLKSRKVTQTPAGLLNNIAMKMGIPLKYYLVNEDRQYSINLDAKNTPKSYLQQLNDSFRIPQEESQIVGPFKVRAVFGDEISDGLSNTIQQAKHEAATMMLKKLQDKDVNCEDLAECEKRRDALKSPISLVYELGQKNGLDVDFVVIDRAGPSHKPVFTTRCTVGQFQTEADGKSLKDSKKFAAELMLKNLENLPEIFSMNGIMKKIKPTKKKRPSKKIQQPNLMEKITDQLSNLMSFIKPAQPENKLETNEKTSHKRTLLKIAKLLQIDVNFMDLDKKNGLHRTLLSLNLNQPQLCLGESSTKEDSLNDAALNGLKFLKKIKLIYNNPGGNEDDYNVEIIPDANPDKFENNFETF